MEYLKNKSQNYKFTAILILILFSNISLGQSIASKKIQTITIDAGHGGKDPGAIGSFSKEKDITLPIALKFGEKIKKQNPDVKVIYTRETDEFIELYQRANIANKSKSDIFVSIHVNSNNNKNAHGIEFYVLGLHKADENLSVAKKENSVVDFEGNVTDNYGFNPNSPEGNIIMTMKQSLFLDKSIEFAKECEHSFESLHMKNRGTKQAGFVVLYQTSMPSCLVETGFISNNEEEKYLNSEKGQEEIAEKLATSFNNYKQRYEKRSSLDEDILEKPKAIFEPENDDKKETQTKSNTLSIEKPVKAEKNSSSMKIEDGYNQDIDVSYRYSNPAEAAKHSPSEQIVEITKPTKTYQKGNLELIKPKIKKTSAEDIKLNTSVVDEKSEYYAIQISASSIKKQKNDKIYSTLNSVYESREGGYYKYLVGQFPTKNGAVKELVNIKAKGYKDAFIVHYVDGKRK